MNLEKYAPAAQPFNFDRIFASIWIFCSLTNERKNDAGYEVSVSPKVSTGQLVNA